MGQKRPVERSPTAEAERVQFRAMVIGIPRELVPGEDRVALVPGSVAPLTKSGAEVIVEQGEGAHAAPAGPGEVEPGPGSGADVLRG